MSKTIVPAAGGDRLPPHSVEAEQGVLGCVMIDPENSYRSAEERFQGEDVFYDSRHQEIWRAMTHLWRESRAIDVISTSQKLKDAGRLDAAGGLSYLSSLMDVVPSAANLPTYLEIVWEKFLARQLLRSSAEISESVLHVGGVTEPLLEKIKRLQGEFDLKSQRGTLTPKYLKPPSAFQDDYMARFFGGGDAEPGLDLPIGFPMKIRRKEATLFTGDDGAGKSTALGYFGIHLAAQGEKLCIASLEMPPSVTLWTMAAQLLGSKHLPDTQDGMRQAVDALAWLNSRALLYDFLGIGDWRDILDTFRYAARRQDCTVFILDSVMRIGIPDDDYAGQGLAAAHFAQFAMEHNAHLFFVIHENKGDGRGKNKVRGSKLWTANANNVLRIEINSDKETRAGELRQKLSADRGLQDEESIRKDEAKLENCRREWDSRLVLQKQRYPGTRQNGAAFLWFDRECFQFRDRWECGPVNWLERWRKKP